MENTRDKILRCIFNTAVELNISFMNINTVLIGKDSVLDSLTFVTYIVAVEQKVSDAFGTKITLANSRAFSQEKNPFETIDSLASYIEELIDDR